MDPSKLIPFEELIQIANHLTNPLTNNSPETQAINLSEESTVNFDQQFFSNHNLKQNWKRKAREKGRSSLVVIHKIETIPKGTNHMDHDGSREKRHRAIEIKSEAKKQCTKPNTSETVELQYKQSLIHNILILGYFNAYLSAKEKKGRGVDIHHAIKVQSFRSLLNGFRLLDLGYQGSPFTWNNQRDSSFNIQERLDRACASPRWLNLYPYAMVHHIEDVGSDHKPLLLIADPTLKKSKRRFKFDMRWVGNFETKNIINIAWSKQIQGHRQFQLFQKLKKYRHALLS
uniref:Endonuclease/exonuclease/phosphatase domain-containing protein n=1 Tax=Manihot esculenta TaxID=3983 RepID=A0A2C9U8H8_MANES